MKKGQGQHAGAAGLNVVSTGGDARDQAARLLHTHVSDCWSSEGAGTLFSPRLSISASAYYPRVQGLGFPCVSYLQPAAIQSNTQLANIHYHYNSTTTTAATPLLPSNGVDTGSLPWGAFRAGKLRAEIWRYKVLGFFGRLKLLWVFGILNLFSGFLVRYLLPYLEPWCSQSCFFRYLL